MLVYPATAAPPPRGMRLYYAAYFYRCQHGASCEACNWFSLGLFDTALEAFEAADKYQKATGDRVKVGTAYDY